MRESAYDMGAIALTERSVPACHQVIFLALACKITSYIFIARFPADCG